MNKNIFQTMVDAFEDLADWIHERGWWRAVRALLFLIITAMVILAFYYSYILIRQIEQNSVASKIILEDVHQTPEQLQDGLQESVSDNLKIEGIMTQCLYEHGGDAIIVAKFHDSKTDLQGRHDFFYSVTNEVTRKDVPSFLPETQNIPIVRLGESILPFLDKKCQILSVKDDFENNHFLREKFIKEGIEETLSCPLYDITGKYLIGFTELVYLNGNEFLEKNDGVIPSKDEDCFRNSTEIISAIISK